MGVFDDDPDGFQPGLSQRDRPGHPLSHMYRSEDASRGGGCGSAFSSDEGRYR
jgi:hypothetical protein